MLYSYYKKYILHIIKPKYNRYIYIHPSSNQTKEWRKSQKWYRNGKYNECEKYQINLIEGLFGKKLKKTNERINLETNAIIDNSHPLSYRDGFEQTENFDRKLILNKIPYYFNLKFVCGDGGAQNRTIRDVYNFIKHQLEHIMKYKTQKKNIL